MKDTGFGQRFRAALAVIGITVLGAVAGIVAGLMVGAIPGVMAFFESNSGGWTGMARAMGYLLLAGGFGLIGTLAGIWLGFRKVHSKAS